MDCATICRNYSRFILVFFNFLFVVTGAIILSVGVSVKAYYHEYNTFLDDKYFYLSDLLIVVGVIIFIIAFFGCCGALKENVCMTVTFSTLLIVILILELIIGIGGFLLKHRTEEMIDKALTKTLQEYDTNSTELNAIWDQVQQNFNCCGVHNYTDWIEKTSNTNYSIPIACCSFPAGSSGTVSCEKTSPYLHQIGCLEVFSDYIEGHALSIESVGLTLAVIQLLGIILSCYLSKQIKSDYETV